MLRGGRKRNGKDDLKLKRQSVFYKMPVLVCHFELLVDMNTVNNTNSCRTTQSRQGIFQRKKRRLKTSKIETSLGGRVVYIDTGLELSFAVVSSASTTGSYQAATSRTSLRCTQAHGRGPGSGSTELMPRGHILLLAIPPALCFRPGV